jgi:hypothetical protein
MSQLCAFAKAALIRSLAEQSCGGTGSSAAQGKEKNYSYPAKP